MILPPKSQISPHHKVTNITMSPTSLSPLFLIDIIKPNQENSTGEEKIKMLYCMNMTLLHHLWSSFIPEYRRNSCSDMVIPIEHNLWNLKMMFFSLNSVLLELPKPSITRTRFSILGFLSQNKVFIVHERMTKAVFVCLIKIVRF